ncbi:shufflon system plasmid conjugative transfer pilus tip adhesin PilV [Photorhabdus temperata]|nr:shufflon system plasmid conjugative transfer pilus tip adhesin PilV [Photorhabdus temperata]
MVLTTIIIPASVWTVNEYRNTVTAGQARTVQNAVNKYISDNATSISASATATSPFTLTVPMLVSANYLPAGYASTNNFSSTYQTKIFQPATGKFHVMTFLTGGVDLKLSQARNIAIKIGAAGGYIESGIAKGALGAWSENLSTFGGFNPGDGHIVIAGFYQNGAISNDYLYRKAIPGHPELNTMSTALNMGGNDMTNSATVHAQNATITNTVTAANANVSDMLNSGKIMATGKITSSDIVEGKYLYPSQVATAGKACLPNGIIARDNSGSAMSCKNGKWNRMGGLAQNHCKQIGNFGGRDFTHYKCPVGWYAAGLQFVGHQRSESAYVITCCQ